MLIRKEVINQDVIRDLMIGKVAQHSLFTQKPLCLR